MHTAVGKHQDVSGRAVLPRGARLFLTFLLAILVPLLAATVTFTAPVAAAGDPTIAAAGDIACDPTDANFNHGQGSGNFCQELAVSNLLVNGNFAAVLPLGDDQYYCGSLTAFQNSYNQSWGRLKAITHPVPGNHEFLTSGASDCTSSNAGGAGYYGYFGSAAGSKGAGYYSYDVGAWHLIALNSSCSSAGGCSASSPQGKWLASDLAAHPNQCTLAYWHIPLFSSGGRANSGTLPLWNLLYAAHADVVLDGHDHIYERFSPQTPTGASDPTNGIRQFTVGTGGANHTGIVSIAANSVIRNTTSYGVLALTLHQSSYSWNFESAVGSLSDSGSANCHTAAAAPSPSPSATASASASASPTSVPSASPTTAPSASPTTAPTASPTTAPTASPTSAPTASPTTAPTASPAPTSGPTSTPIVATSTLNPVADSYVDASNPTVNNGTSTQLRIDGSPVVRSFLRFDLTGLTGTVTSATLRIYANSAQSTGYDVFPVADNTWGETTITDSNAPPFGSTKLGSSGAIVANSWTSVNLTSGVTAGGLISFGISTTNSTAVALSSRTGANPPQLVVTTSSGAATLPLPPARPNPLIPVVLLLIPILAPGLLLLQRNPVRRSMAGSSPALPSPR